MDDKAREEINKIKQSLLDSPDEVEVEIDDEDEFEGEFQIDPDKSLVLLLGDIRHEGITSALAAADRQYKQKYPESKPENWETIIELFDEFDVSEVIWKLIPKTYDLMYLSQYDDVSERLLAAIASRRHVLFIHQELLFGRMEEERVGNEFYRKQKRIVSKINALLENHKLNVLPYFRNAEATVMALEFIAQTELGLLLRVYVPSGRLWSNETDRLLQLFRDYLTRASNIKVRLDQTRTNEGVIYEFHGEPDSTYDLNAEIEQFSTFLDLCLTDPNQAEEVLANKNISAREVAEILARFTKEARRLHIDLKQERERKVLTIRHRLESELVDVLTDPSQQEQIDALVNSIIPQHSSSRAAIAVDRPPLQISNAANVVVNLQPRIINAVNSIVADEIQGDANLSKHDHELLTLIQQFGGTSTIQLTSAVHELADTSAPQPGRLVAKGKLMKFVNAIGSTLGDVAAGVLQKYIENQIGL